MTDETNKPISEMNKDELAAVAAELGVEIDKRHKLEDLRKEVAGLVSKGVQPPKAGQDELKEKAKFVKNPKTGFVFPATELLMKRTDLVWLDKDKKVIPRTEESQEVEAA